MTAYIKSLERLAVAGQRQNPANLHQRLSAWLTSLPPMTRDRPFSMQEFESALGTQGKYISAVLLNLGWQRKRKWANTGRYHRYWLPPMSN